MLAAWVYLATKSVSFSFSKLRRHDDGPLPHVPDDAAHAGALCCACCACCGGCAAVHLAPPCLLPSQLHRSSLPATCFHAYWHNLLADCRGPTSMCPPAGLCSGGRPLGCAGRLSKRRRGTLSSHGLKHAGGVQRAYAACHRASLGSLEFCNWTTTARTVGCWAWAEDCTRSWAWQGLRALRSPLAAAIFTFVPCPLPTVLSPAF